MPVACTTIESSALFLPLGGSFRPLKVVFLEDETGFVNVVVWESVFQRCFVLARTVSFLGITGNLQVEGGVVHLVA